MDSVRRNNPELTKVIDRGVAYIESHPSLYPSAGWRRFQIKNRPHFWYSVKEHFERKHLSAADFPSDRAAADFVWQCYERF